MSILLLIVTLTQTLIKILTLIHVTPNLNLYHCEKLTLIFPYTNPNPNLTKTVFNMEFQIYVVGWYVEQHAARRDPSLKAFEGLSDNELASSSAFYEAIEGDASYDRTLFVKLAMNLKTEMMITGLVAELEIQPKNAVR